MPFDLSKPPLSGVEMHVPGPGKMARTGVHGVRGMIKRRRAASMSSQSAGGPYYWIIGKVNGVVCRDGPHNDDVEARLIAKDRFDPGKYRVIPLNTRDPSRARQLLAHVRLDAGESDPLAIQHRPDAMVSTGL